MSYLADWFENYGNIFESEREKKMFGRVLAALREPIAPVAEVASTDAKDAALWRDLTLLHPMDLVTMFSGAKTNGILREKLAYLIEAKRAGMNGER